MRVFILEDDPRRIAIFREHLPCQLDITDQVDLAMEWLNTNKYDYIFLDHDLEGRQYVDSDEFNTGATVARRLHETPNKKLSIIVHSLNLRGAKVMMREMRNKDMECHYCPFGGSKFADVIEKTKKRIKLMAGTNEEEEAVRGIGENRQT